MLNRLLCLCLAVLAPFGAVVLWFTSAPHAATSFSLIDRLPGIALAALSLALALGHLRRAPRALSLRAVAWLGLTGYFVICATLAPHIGVWLGLAVLAMAGTSLTMLVGGRTTQRAAPAQRVAASFA